MPWRRSAEVTAVELADVLKLAFSLLVAYAVYDLVKRKQEGESDED